MLVEQSKITMQIQQSLRKQNKVSILQENIACITWTSGIMESSSVCNISYIIWKTFQ